MGKVSRFNVCIGVLKFWHALHHSTSYLQFLLLFSLILMSGLLDILVPLTDVVDVELDGLWSMFVHGKSG